MAQCIIIGDLSEFKKILNEQQEKFNQTTTNQPKLEKWLDYEVSVNKVFNLILILK